MNKIPYDDILNIQRKVNIVDVIAGYLPIEQKGKNYFAICPFHDDHNPSMSISPEKQIYTCFVCGASGNVFNFVMNYEKISFIEAVKKVAELSGISLDVQVKEKQKPETKYDKYYKMFEIVNKYYQNNIKTVYGKGAVSYLNKRNITDDIIKEFEIGLSLNDNAVAKFLKEKNYKKDELVDIGICGVKDNYTYDIFRNRIMFPLHDANGQAVGFSGRTYNGEADSKYVNSKESVIFKKGKLLYNYKRAFEHARDKRQIIVVEGFMDVIRLYTIGIKNVVATMGTAITKEHVDLIKKLSKNVVLCFDGDKAGEKATVAALDALEKVGLTPRIIRLEDNLDPDDYISKKGEKNFLNHLKNTMSPLEFKLELSKKETDFNDYKDISNYISKITKELEKIDDKIVFELTIKKLAKETNVDEETIKSLIKKVPEEKINIVRKRETIKKDKYEKAEEYLVHYMLKKPDAILLYQNKVSYLSNKLLSKIAIEIMEFYDKNHYIDITDFTLYLEDKTELINEVLRLDNLNMPNSVDNFVIEDYIKTIDEGIIKREIQNLKNKISKESDIAKKVILLEKLASLKKRSVNDERN